MKPSLMSLNLYFETFHSVNIFKNLGYYNEELGERFHHDMEEMERRFGISFFWQIIMLKS